MSTEQETPSTQGAPAPEAAQAPRPSGGVPHGAPGRRPMMGGRRPGGRGGRDFRPRKVCKFCVERDAKIDYKDVVLLRGYVSDRGKMWAGRNTGLCAWHQRKITEAVKRARTMALLPFASTAN